MYYVIGLSRNVRAPVGPRFRAATASSAVTTRWGRVADSSAPRFGVRRLVAALSSRVPNRLEGEAPAEPRLKGRAEPALSLPNVSRPYLEGEAPAEPILRVLG